MAFSKEVKRAYRIFAIVASILIPLAIIAPIVIHLAKENALKNFLGKPAYSSSSTAEHVVSYNRTKGMLADHKGPDSYAPSEAPDAYNGPRHLRFLAKRDEDTINIK
ncbi:hypothetical protein FKW77_001166, partial [Venturia effusa]